VSVSPEQRLADALSRGGGSLSLAESCTGGLIAHRITDLPGASEYFECCLVVYSNRAKVELLGVPEELLAAHGAVSEACARAMLAGLFARTPARLAAAVTGIAGPGGGTATKPVGTVWVAWGRAHRPRTELLRLAGNRREIKALAAEAVLERLAEAAGEGP
jgi:nicotinamide-nucleotide amidase